MIFLVVFLFSGAFLQAETENHRAFVEMGWVQPYGIHLGYGISYFYSGINVFFNEKESITLNKKYYGYYLLEDGSYKNKTPELLIEEDINSMGKSIWVQFPLGVQLDVIKRNNFIFSVREAWIPSIVNVVYDKELYCPDNVYDDKHITEVKKNITHLFWRDGGLKLLSDRTMYHAFYPLCFETTFQFVFYNFWTISLGAILDTGFIERSRFSVSFGISKPFAF